MQRLTIDFVAKGVLEAPTPNTGASTTHKPIDTADPPTVKTVHSSSEHAEGEDGSAVVKVTGDSTRVREGQEDCPASPKETLPGLTAFDLAIKILENCAFQNKDYLGLLEAVLALNSDDKAAQVVSRMRHEGFEGHLTDLRRQLSERKPAKEDGRKQVELECLERVMQRLGSYTSCDRVSLCFSTSLFQFCNHIRKSNCLSGSLGIIDAVAVSTSKPAESTSKAQLKNVPAVAAEDTATTATPASTTSILPDTKTDQQPMTTGQICRNIRLSLKEGRMGKAIEFMYMLSPSAFVDGRLLSDLVLRATESHRISPQNVHALLLAIYKRGAHGHALMLTQRIDQLGWTYSLPGNVKVDSYSKHEKHEKAVESFNQLLKSGTTVHAASYDAVLSSLTELGDDAQYLRVFNTMLDNGRMPSTFAYARAVQLHLKSRDLASSLAIIRHVDGIGLRLPPALYSECLHALATEPPEKVNRAKFASLTVEAMHGALQDLFEGVAPAGNSLGSSADGVECAKTTDSPSSTSTPLETQSTEEVVKSPLTDDKCPGSSLGDVCSAFSRMIRADSTKEERRGAWAELTALLQPLLAEQHLSPCEVMLQERKIIDDIGASLRAGDQQAAGKLCFLPPTADRPCPNRVSLSAPRPVGQRMARVESFLDFLHLKMQRAPAPLRVTQMVTISPPHTRTHAYTETALDALDFARLHGSNSGIVTVLHACSWVQREDMARELIARVATEEEEFLPRVELSVARLLIGRHARRIFASPSTHACVYAYVSRGFPLKLDKSMLSSPELLGLVFFGFFTVNRFKLLQKSMPPAVPRSSMPSIG